jgi:competence protein ComEC
VTSFAAATAIVGRTWTLTAPPRQWLMATLAAEASRWALWLAVGFGAGIAVYFALPSEPPPWLGATVAAAAAGAATAARRRLALAATGIALTSAALGFAAAQAHTALAEAPRLGRALGPTAIDGRIVELSTLEVGVSLVLDRVRIAGLASAATPARVRIVAKTRRDPIAVGDRVQTRAMLRPPSPPLFPGGFDFARKAYFERIGASGYAIAPIRRAAAEVEPVGIDIVLNRARQRINEAIDAALPPGIAAIAKALMTGDRAAMPETDVAAMRDSGLAHLLAISGINISFMAGIVFFVVRAGLALVPPLALRYPIKKIAAGAGFLAAAAYLAITGLTVPTQRAFLMMSAVFLAIVVERSVLSMRLAAWAAIIVLAVSPIALAGPSFQLSFAAVVALIAAYETGREPWSAARQRRGWLGRAFFYVAGVAVTTLVAGFATAPFAIFHFNRFAVYGLAANLLAIPLTGAVIMPAIAAAYVLLVFGFAEPAFAVLGWGIEAMLWVARTVAAWPGAALLVPAMPSAGLATAALGLIWLCLWQRPWRWAGLGAVAVGLFSIGIVPGPDLLVDAEGAVVAVRNPAGDLLVSDPRERWATQLWLRANAQSSAAPWPAAGDSAETRLRCDTQGCLYRVGGRTVAWLRDPRALAEDCAAADVVIAPFFVGRRCGAATVIDRRSLSAGGGHAIRVERDGTIRIESVAAARGARPWSGAPPVLRDGRGTSAGQRCEGGACASRSSPPALR